MPHDKSTSSYSNRPIREKTPAKKTPPDYLLRAQDLQVFTINKCRTITKNPDMGGKSMTNYFCLPMAEEAKECVFCCSDADENYPTCRRDYIDRRRSLHGAMRHAKRMSRLLTVSMDIESLNISSNVRTEWANKINRVIAILNKTIKRNDELYSTLPDL